MTCHQSDTYEAMDLQSNYPFLLQELEKRELEKGDNCPPRVYTQMLAIYLAMNDLTNAKFLWKRIPDTVKQECSELKAVWEIGKKLLTNDIASVYGLIEEYEWPSYLSNVVKYLREEISKRTIQLIGKSYASICFQDMMKMVGIKDKQEAMNLAKSLNWSVDESFGFFISKKATFDEENVTSNQEQLEKLAEYVAFLENYI